MNTVRGPTSLLFIEELGTERVIQKETMGMNKPSYFISTQTGIFSPRVLFIGVLTNIVPLEIEEEPAFLSEENSTPSRDVSSHVIELKGVTGNTVSGLIPKNLSEIKVGDRLIVLAKIFNPTDAEEFLDVFLRIEEIKLLDDHDFLNEWGNSCNNFNKRLKFLKDFEKGSVNLYSEDSNFFLRSHQMSSRFVNSFSSEQMNNFYENIKIGLRKLLDEK